MSLEVNNSENQIDNAIINELKAIREEFNLFRATPQQIGNGSINYGILSSNLLWGPVTIASGATNIFSTTLFPGTITYAGLPAINRVTFMEFAYTISVDTNTTAFDYPSGTSLTVGQQNLNTSVWCDLANSSFATNSGKRTWYISIRNNDSVSHNYYIRANVLIPRPALKPQ